MNQYLPILKHAPLFRGLAEEEIAAMLGCLGATLRTYQKGELVFRQGEAVREIAVLAEGRLHIRRDDYWGNSNLIGTVEAGELFGDAYLSPGSGAILNNVLAVEASAVLFLDARRAITTCPSSCRFHAMVVQNLFFAICDKNRKLVQKIGHMSHRTTREKLMSYLSEEAARQNSSTVVIPFNRQQLADFLSVDRSAMSNELSKMRRDGLLLFEKNRFTLL